MRLDGTEVNARSYLPTYLALPPPPFTYLSTHLHTYTITRPISPTRIAHDVIDEWINESGLKTKKQQQHYCKFFSCVLFFLFWLDLHTFF